MSNLSIANRYSMYSNLISQTYKTNNTSTSTVNSLLGMYSYIYGTQSSTVSAETSEYLVDLKESAGITLDDINDIKGTSTKITANSDSSAVSTKYTGATKKDDVKIDVYDVASGQTNESESFKSNASSIYYSKATKINITTSAGKSVSINYSSASSETDEKALKKIASKINKANVGVTASVEKDSKTNTSKLVVKGKEGSENSFEITGKLAEKLGIDNVKKEATDARYSINGEDIQTSSTNEIKVDDELTVTLKEKTEKTATISYGKNNITTINKARKLVNAFNELAGTAYSSDDSGAEKLGNRLQSIAKTYAPSLSKIGVTLNSKGYLTIDEDKMAASAKNGDLDNFFETNGTNKTNYGFTNRLETLAKRVDKDPTQYLSSEAKAEVNSSNSSYYSNVGSANYNYISAYYRYSNTALLFNAFA